MKNNKSLITTENTDESSLSESGLHKVHILKQINLPVEPLVSMFDVTVEIRDVKEGKYAGQQEVIKAFSHISNTFSMIFGNARKLLCNDMHGLSAVDFYMFLFLCEHYSNKDTFDVGPEFMKQIKLDLAFVNASYSDRSIKESINKLFKVGFLFKQGKGLYSVSKTIAFAGNTAGRAKAIEEQYHKSAEYNYNLTK